LFAIRLLLLLLLAQTAQAELYRWVDPETGSVKFSSYPPERPGLKVEVLRYDAPGAPAKRPGAEQGASLAPLEARWREQLAELAALQLRPAPERNAQNLQQRLQAYASVAAELDRRDPQRAAARRAELERVLEKVRQSMEDR
jgi:hypothetical protein